MSEKNIRKKGSTDGGPESKDYDPKKTKEGFIEKADLDGIAEKEAKKALEKKLEREKKKFKEIMRK